jgi:hypothetical protein
MTYLILANVVDVDWISGILGADITITAFIFEKKSIY